MARGGAGAAGDQVKQAARDRARQVTNDSHDRFQKGSIAIVTAVSSEHSVADAATRRAELARRHDELGTAEEQKRKYEVTRIEKECDRYLASLLWVRLTGGLAAAIGGALWFSRVQRPQDAILQADAKKAVSSSVVFAATVLDLPPEMRAGS